MLRKMFILDSNKLDGLISYHRHWNFFSSGAITIKQANSDKGINHKHALFEHFDFFIKKNFGRIFFATCF
jgi:hypothetical protein